MSLSKIIDVLPENYGYVVFLACDSIFINMWLAMRVEKARKKFNVKAPIMYSPDSTEFNCIQRAHQHTLENHPAFVTLLLLGGLQHPRFAAACGAVYLLGTVVYAKGYSSTNPENKSRGEFGMVGFLGLLGSTLCFAAHQLKWSHPSWMRCC